MMFAAILGAVQIFRNPLVSPPPTTEATVIRSYPHDPSAFTQGLFFEPGGTLLESTGLYGESSIRRVELDSGRVINSNGGIKVGAGSGIGKEHRWVSTTGPYRLTRVLPIIKMATTGRTGHPHPIGYQHRRVNAISTCPRHQPND